MSKKIDFGSKFTTSVVIHPESKYIFVYGFYEKLKEYASLYKQKNNTTNTTLCGNLYNDIYIKYNIKMNMSAEMDKDLFKYYMIDKLVDTLSVPPSPMPSTPESPSLLNKQRVPVEYNGMELVFAILVLYENIITYEQMMELITDIRIYPYNHTNLIFNDFEVDFTNYVKDIQIKKKQVNDYIVSFLNIHINTEKLQKNKIKCVYISGKTNRHVRIMELNAGLDKKETKADVYIEYLTGVIAGISIKQCVNATKSNYSVHKMFENKELDKILTEEKRNYLNNHGFLSFNKKDRPTINKLFYPQNKENAYWVRIKEEIANNNKKITDKLIQLLYCLNVPYEMYEFDGVTFTHLNHSMDVLTNNICSFEEHIPYYFNKNGEERKTAKLFYRLTIGETIYRVEIRWKGNIYDASPQFQIHKDT